MRRRHSPEDHHMMWKTQAKLQSEQYGVAEHAHLLDLLETAGSYDQLDLGNCAFAEKLVRRLQVLVWSYAEKTREGTGGGTSSSGSRLDLEEVSAFSGKADNSGIMVDPRLLEHVKAVTAREAEILKNIRKAREERLERAKKK
jgi:hypothetical protein